MENCDGGGAAGVVVTLTEGSSGDFSDIGRFADDCDNGWW